MRINFQKNQGLGIIFLIWGKILGLEDKQTPTWVPPLQYECGAQSASFCQLEFSLSEDGGGIAKLSSGCIPVVTKPAFFGVWEILSSVLGTLSRNFSQKNNNIVNKVILEVLHLIFTLVLYIGQKYGQDNLSTNAKDRG